MQGEQQLHRITRYRGLKALGVPYSFKHIVDLEKTKRFPQRVQLGPNSIGWVTSEVVEWVEERIRRRVAPSPKGTAAREARS
jgi:predicted DNA-binding transcriptional regulator AlpA